MLEMALINLAFNRTYLCGNQRSNFVFLERLHNIFLLLRRHRFCFCGESKGLPFLVKFSLSGEELNNCQATSLKLSLEGNFGFN
jgi:hypothetical protein